jgi:lysophospholipase L1-like esterase
MSLTNQVLFLGDSITAGNHVPAGQDIPTKVAASYSAIAAHYQNLGIGSTYANEDGSHTDGGQGVTADGLFDGTKQVNIAVIFFGANDVADAATRLNFTTAFKTYCLARRSAGFKILIVSTLPNTAITSNGFESTRLSANTTNLSDGTFWDYFANVAADPIMGLQATNSNATYYSDGVHPTPTGNDLLVPWFVDALKVLIELPRSVAARAV